MGLMAACVGHDWDRSMSCVRMYLLRQWRWKFCPLNDAVPRLVRH